jgi:hypothetical protein
MYQIQTLLYVFVIYFILHRNTFECCVFHPVTTVLDIVKYKFIYFILHRNTIENNVAAASLPFFMRVNGGSNSSSLIIYRRWDLEKYFIISIYLPTEQMWHTTTGQQVSR